MRNSGQDATASEPGASSAHSFSQRSRSEILAIGGLAALVIYSVVRSVIAAEAKPLWFDEICTWIIARLGSPQAIWQALKNAADGQPPLFYLIEAYFGSLVRHQEIAVRIP